MSQRLSALIAHGNYLGASKTLDLTSKECNLIILGVAGHHQKNVILEFSSYNPAS